MTISQFLNNRLVGAVITVFITFVGLWFIVSKTMQPEPTKPDLPLGTTAPISVEPSQFPDYDSLKDLHATELLQEKDSSSRNINDDALTNIKLSIKGRFSRMYLYTEVSVNNKPLTDWDSLYIKFNTSPPILTELQAGGHLYRSKSLAVLTDNKATRLLYNTSVVPYLSSAPYSEARIPEIVDWFSSVFDNDGSSTSTVRFDTFLSTKRNGKIHLIALYYDCDSETPECFISKK